MAPSLTVRSCNAVSVTSARTRRAPKSRSARYEGRTDREGCLSAVMSWFATDVTHIPNVEMIAPRAAQYFDVDRYRPDFQA
jgi:hypothetical protein